VLARDLLDASERADGPRGITVHETGPAIAQRGVRREAERASSRLVAWAATLRHGRTDEREVLIGTDHRDTRRAERQDWRARAEPVHEKHCGGESGFLGQSLVCLRSRDRAVSHGG